MFLVCYIYLLLCLQLRISKVRHWSENLKTNTASGASRTTGCISIMPFKKLCSLDVHHLVNMVINPTRSCKFFFNKGPPTIKWHSCMHLISHDTGIIYLTNYYGRDKTSLKADSNIKALFVSFPFIKESHLSQDCVTEKAYRDYRKESCSERPFLSF